MSHDLVLRARNGDHEAFTTLVAASFDSLFRLARLILRDDELAADAVQNALLSAWLHIRAVREPERFEAWLRRLVVRACYRESSRSRRVRAVEVSLWRALDDGSAVRLVAEQVNDFDVRD